MKKLFIIFILISLLGSVSFSTNTIDVDRVDYKTGNQMGDAKDVILKSIFENNDLDINRMTIKNEEEFIEYMEGVFGEIKNIISKDGVSKDDREILRKTFVDFADFILYDKEIKGYRFKDLSITAKKSMLKLFNDFDSKIEDKYPNYKNNLESISKRNYKNIKEKISKLLSEYKGQIKTDAYMKGKKESQNIFSKINKKVNDLIKKVSE